MFSAGSDLTLLPLQELWPLQESYGPCRKIMSFAGELCPLQEFFRKSLKGGPLQKSLKMANI